MNASGFFNGEGWLREGPGGRRKTKGKGWWPTGLGR